MADIELVIKISEEEFGIDINDKFQDFFQRLKAEIKGHTISGRGLVCGAYELETIEMFLNAFENSTLLPKGQGREKDMSKEQETTIAMLLEIRKTDVEIINDLKEKVELQEQLIEEQNTLIETQEERIELQKKIIEKQQELIKVLKELCNEEL